MNLIIRTVSSRSIYLKSFSHVSYSSRKIGMQKKKKCKKLWLQVVKSNNLSILNICDFIWFHKNKRIIIHSTVVGNVTE